MELPSKRSWSDVFEDTLGTLGVALALIFSLSVWIYVQLVRSHVMQADSDFEYAAIHLAGYSCGLWGTLFINMVFNFFKDPFGEAERHLVGKKSRHFPIWIKMYSFLITVIFGFIAVWWPLHAEGTWTLFFSILVGTTIASELSAPCYRRFVRKIRDNQHRT